MNEEPDEPEHLIVHYQGTVLADAADVNGSGDEYDTQSELDHFALSYHPARFESDKHGPEWDMFLDDMSAGDGFIMGAVREHLSRKRDS